MLSYRQKYFAPDEPYHYVSPQAKRFIVWLVIGLHVALFVIPGLIFAFVSWLKPDLVLVSKVVLVDSMPNDHTAPSRNPGQDPQPQDDVSAPPENLPDIPEIKEVPVPKPQPQKKVVQPKPKPKPQKKVVQPKPKPTWKALDAKDIKIQRSSQTRNRNQNKTNALSDLAKQIRADAGRSGGAGGPMGKYHPDANDYYQRVGAYLRSKWVDQPDISALGGRRPFVLVMFHITPNGKIISTKIQQNSGVPVMDESVRRFLRTLNWIPAPPDRNMTRFTVRMRIED